MPNCLCNAQPALVDRSRRWLEGERGFSASHYLTRIKYVMQMVVETARRPGLYRRLALNGLADVTVVQARLMESSPASLICRDDSDPRSVARCRSVWRVKVSYYRSWPGNEANIFDMLCQCLTKLVSKALYLRLGITPVPRAQKTLPKSFLGIAKATPVSSGVVEKNR